MVVLAGSYTTVVVFADIVSSMVVVTVGVE